MYKQGMTFRETIYLIKAILETGSTLKLRSKHLVDKHSIGGVAGNRTTPIVVAICAAAGLKMPKTSSRAITSASGTADTIETIANVEFEMPRLKHIISQTNAFMAWGGALGMVPADSKIIKIEKSLKLDPEAQLLASIMSKKLAVGSKYLLIDIPYGKTAKVSRPKAEDLKRKFIRLAKYFRIKIKVVITDGKEPIGNGIGPALELVDVIKILDQNECGPEDLEEKSLFLAGELLELTKKAKKGQGFKLAQEILHSGRAFEKFKQIICAQDGKSIKLKNFKYSHNLLSKTSGKILEIDNKKINSLARVLGCPADKFSGVYLHKHVFNKIKKGEKLLTLYAESKPRLNEGIRYFKREKIIRIK
jgi:putative thymidine phosphorylase